MKIQKLTIHNIASIEDAVIDFEAQPLADSEVFLITGKTGSGKSTILDAICLALYADTPRLENTKMEGQTKEGKTKTGDNLVSLSDPRQLLRRNTGEASVSLTFIGSNGKHYEACWSVSRARQNSTGNLQGKNWQLKNLDTNNILTKDAEIKAELKDAIGLDFNQFCRTTMLAQGEFTRFLNSKDDEKSEILEKITGVDIYSKIGKKVYEITGQKRKDWENAQQCVKNTTTLSDEEITAKNDKLLELYAEQKKNQEESSIYTAKLDWLNREQELNEEKEKANNEFEQIKQTIDSERFKTDDQIVKDWNNTIEARHFMNEADKASENIDAQDKKLEQLANTYTKLSAGQQYAMTEIGNIEAKINDINTYITSVADKIDMYNNAQTIVSYLNAIDAGRNAIKIQNAEIDSEKKKLEEEFTPAYDKAKADVKIQQQEFNKAEANLKAKEKALEELNLSSLRKKRDDANELIRNIKTANERIDALTAAKTKHQQEKKNLEDLNKSIDTNKRKSAAIDQPIATAKTKMDTCKENLEKQRDSINKFATSLRAKLKVGDTCPICGQEIKVALPLEEELAEIVKELQDSYDEAEKNYNKLVEEKRTLDAQITSDTATYYRANKLYQENQSVAEAEQKALSACKDCNHEPLNNIDAQSIESTAPSLLQALESATSKSRDKLENNIQSGELQDLEVKKLRSALEEKREKIEALKATERKAEDTVKECNNKISTAKKIVESKKKEVNDAQDNAEASIVGNWQNNWREMPTKFATELTYSTKEYNNKVQDKQTYNHSLEAEQTMVKSVQEVLNIILTAMPSWEETKPANAVKVENLLMQANILNTSVATALSHLKSAKESLSENDKKLKDFYTKNTCITKERLVELDAYKQTDITAKSDWLTKIRTDEVAKKTLLKDAIQHIEEHKNIRPDLAENDNIDTLKTRITDLSKQLTKISEEKGAINQELENDKTAKQQLGKLIEDAEKLNTEYKKWSRLNSLIGCSTGKTFRNIAQSYILSNLIHSANNYMKTLTDRYTLKVTPGTFVISLEDAYQGYVSRVASTISGGESFLVSLSLALALSDIGQQWQIDTLFIDEGFGTLSGEPLQNAVNTLKSLHSKSGRHVGIISHVDELRERIPVQIQVNQEGHNSCSKVQIVTQQ